MAMIIDGKKRIPFLRGMLTHYLMEHGFSYQDAYLIADQIRGNLRETNEVSADTIIDLVRSQVLELFGNRSIGDGIFWEPIERQVLVEDEQGRRPFSRGRLSHSLTIVGLDDMRAYRTAEIILASFSQEGKKIVFRDEIREAVLNYLDANVSKTIAARYHVWNEFRYSESSKPLIILVGGTSGVGKTSVSVALANLLKISRVAATDEIREVMRLMIGPNLIPTLHASSYAAWEKISTPPPENVDPVIYAFREQATRVCVGVKGTIERALEENVSLVLDGIHLIPELMNLDVYGKQAMVIQVNLYLTDMQFYVERFGYRGQKVPKRPQHKYLKYLDEILKIQQYILGVGKANKVLALENTDFDETVQTISLQIMDRLCEETEKL